MKYTIHKDFYNTRNGEIFGRARAFRAFTTAAERSAWLDKFIESI